VGPEHLKFGGGASQSAFSPLVLAVVVIVGILICFRGRRQAIALFLAASILIPLDQVLVLGSFHFPMLRVLLLFGMIRMAWSKMASKSEVFSGGMTRLDKTVILFALFTAVNALLLWRDMGMLVRQMGDLYSLFGIYFLMRYLIQDEADSDKAVRALAYIAVAVAAVMTYEHVTGHNPYALLGGARASFYGSLLTREDRLRAMAGFGHPILAGTFGAILVPLFVGLWLKDKKNLKVTLAGLTASTVIVLASASSTPMLAYAGGLMALCLWPLRNLMRPIRWGIVVTLVSLHMVMKSPVWQLIDRMSIVGGSSGYHRYQLVDQCIRHFKDWWLFGVKDTGAWGWDMWDTANQYVSIADSTGLIPFILFVAIIVYGFKYVVAARKGWAGNRNMELYNWSLGAALFANAVGFFGISYWDQTEVVWYALLALIAAAYLAVPAESTATVLTQEAPAPAKLTKPLRPAYVPDTPKTLTSYGRMVTARWSPKSTTK
jgi:hypothetical protein